MKMTKILLVDSNYLFANDLQKELNLHENLDVCGIACDGKSALDAIRRDNPDMVVMDLVLPQMDGLTLLENLRSDSPDKTPTVIICSALSQDDIISRSLHLGAGHYMLKPLPAHTAARRICDVIAPAQAQSSPVAAPAPMNSLDEEITTLFLTIGIPAHIKGYHFLREGVRLAVHDPSMMDHITKQLYPTIAIKFNTEPGKVERAIRHAIDVVWTRGRVENINQAFGIRIFTNQTRPTNSEFIALIADRMLLQRSA
nr:sporulation transcription factor Spo0A [bacterium]